MVTRASQAFHSQLHNNNVRDSRPNIAITPNDQTLLLANSAASIIVGFVSRILLERNFFQNTFVPPEVMLYLANDLIKTFQPPSPNQFSLAKEVNILWKKARGKSLTNEEKSYDMGERKIDELSVFLTVVKCLTIGQISLSFF